MYMKWQTRVSKVPENNTFRLEGAGMLSFGSKVTEKEKTYTSYQKLRFGSGDDAYKLFFHQELNLVFNSSDRESPRAVCVGILLGDVGCHGCVCRRGL